MAGYRAAEAAGLDVTTFLVIVPRSVAQQASLRGRVHSMAYPGVIANVIRTSKFACEYAIHVASVQARMADKKDVGTVIHTGTDGIGVHDRASFQSELDRLCPGPDRWF